MIIPNMGNSPAVSPSGLADALFDAVQQRVLAFLFGQPERRFQSAELIRRVGRGTGAAHRQLRRLAESGLVKVEAIGSQKFYQANDASPIFAELHGLVAKTVGIVGPLRESLAPLGARVRAAAVFGSTVRAGDRASSDVDLLVVGRALRYDQLYDALQRAERALARPVNPMLLSAAEWRRKRAQHGSLVSRLVPASLLFVVGTADDLERTGEPRAHRAAEARGARRR